MKTWGIILLVVGGLLGFGLAVLEGIYKWSYYEVNIIKLVGWAMMIVGLVLVCRKPKKQAPQDP